MNEKQRRRKPVDAKKNRKKFADLAERLLRPNQRVRIPRGEKPTYPSGT